MNAMTQLSPQWRNWIAENLARGCDPHSLIADMVGKGLAATGPYLDEGGWCIDVPSTVPSNGGPFVLCIVSRSRGDDSLFELLVTEIGGAPKHVGDAIEHILRNASQITALTVD